MTVVRDSDFRSLAKVQIPLEPAAEIQTPPRTATSQAYTLPSVSSGTTDLAKTVGASHRKTDEGWSTYFQGNNAINLTGARPSFMSSDSRPGSSSSRNSKGGSYWPDPNLATPTPPMAATNAATPFKPTPSNLRDSSGHMLAASSVPMGSPKFNHSASYRLDTGLTVSDAMHGKISSASSTTDDDNDDYEPVDYKNMGAAYSSGIPESVHELPSWTPVGNTWSGPVQRPARSRGNSTSDFTNNVLHPYYAAVDGKEPNLHSFPMPNSTTQQVVRQDPESSNAMPRIQHPTAAHFAAIGTPQSFAPPHPIRPQETRDYFGPNASRTRDTTNTDVSWLNLGTPAGEPLGQNR